MDEKLTLNDGTELVGHVVETDERLFFYVFEKTLTEVFEMMNDPDKTKKIVAERYGVRTTYKGYKHLKSITEEQNDMIDGMLKKV